MLRMRFSRILLYLFALSVFHPCRTVCAEVEAPPTEWSYAGGSEDAFPLEEVTRPPPPGPIAPVPEQLDPRSQSDALLAYLEVLRTGLLDLSQYVTKYCADAASGHLVVPRIERSADISPTLELVRSYDQPSIYIEPGAPVVVTFEQPVEGGYKRAKTPISIARSGNAVVIFASSVVDAGGEVIAVQLADGSFAAFRILPASGDHRADVMVQLHPQR